MRDRIQDTPTKQDSSPIQFSKVMAPKLPMPSGHLAEISPELGQISLKTIKWSDAKDIYTQSLGKRSEKQTDPTSVLFSFAVVRARLPVTHVTMIVSLLISYRPHFFYPILLIPVDKVFKL